jgi:endonuclease/exonuclease/phosphatase family metal-dependent hydrolase
MKGVGKLISILILIINAVLAAMMILSAYSSYISPIKYPMLSCVGLAFPIFLLLNIVFIFFWCIFRYKFAFLSVVALIICLPQIRLYVPFNFHTEDLPAARFKILSYNVMSFNNMELDNGENPIIQYIAKSNADIVCLQEYSTSQASKGYVNEAYINEMMRSFPYRDITSVGDKSTGNKLAMFSRFPIISARRITYESAYNGSVCYDLLIEGDTITLINNHLESNKLTLKDRENYENILDSLKHGNVAKPKRSLLRKFADAAAIRAMQAQKIAEVIAQSHHKTIVCGDFNDTPLSYAHQVIGKHLNDAFAQSGKGFGISFNRHKFYFRIDHILVSKDIKTYNCVVDHSIKDSDHYPIWCYAAFKTKT